MRKWFNWKTILIVVGSLLVIAIGYATYLYIEVKSTFEAIHEPIVIDSTEFASETSDQSTKESPIQLTIQNKEAPQPISVLLLGIDNWESSGRADTILTLTLDPNTESMKILSIPRDTYTEIIGFDFSDKINHSYAFGGVKTSLQTVENLLDIPIDYVVTVNMEGFMEMVDLMGGIEVTNEFAFSTDTREFPEGNITLSGEDALEYVRMRKEDPTGDFGRQGRQRQVLENLFNNAASINLIWQAPGILKIIRNHVETNLTFDEIVEFQNLYRSTLNNIEHLNFTKGDGRIENGIWYYFLNEEELTEVKETLKQSLK